MKFYQLLCAGAYLYATEDPEEAERWLEADPQHSVTVVDRGDV